MLVAIIYFTGAWGLRFRASEITSVARLKLMYVDGYLAMKFVKYS